MRRSLAIFALSLSFATQDWCGVTVILTCHAEVPPSGGDSSLTAEGQIRAQVLADILRDTWLDAIFVSDFRRTQQTAQPTADRAHIQWQKKYKAIEATRQ